MPYRARDVEPQPDLSGLEPFVNPMSLESKAVLERLRGWRQRPLPRKEPRKVSNKLRAEAERQVKEWSTGYVRHPEEGWEWWDDELPQSFGRVLGQDMESEGVPGKLFPVFRGSITAPFVGQVRLNPPDPSRDVIRPVKTRQMTEEERQRYRQEADGRMA